jgi:hypothetical protein
MPIRPELRWLYPMDWPQLSAIIRFDRAKGCRWRCNLPHKWRLNIPHFFLLGAVPG